MRSARWARLFLFPSFFILLAWQAPIAATQSQTATSNQTSSAAKDPQAVSIVRQALSVGGGIASITTIIDYTGTGTIIYHRDRDIQGSVTVRGIGLGQFRLDANLPTGLFSEVTTGLITTKNEVGEVRQLHYQAPMSPGRLVLPYLQLRPALTSPGLSLAYKGIVEIDGHSAHYIQIQQVLPIADPNGHFSEYHSIDFFIDASTFQVLMMQDVILDHIARQIRYSDFRLVGTILMPFSIGESIIEQPTWAIQLDHVTFNSGLQDSDFQL